jgi:serine-type D-Ala-D-Ala carboxypeptidase (penicillin-binding protein 5/6)
MMRMNLSGRAGTEVAVVALLLILSSGVVQAQQHGESFICIEAETGMVIVEHNADLVRPPASVVKLMIMLLVSEGLDAGAWTLDTPITTSKLAASMGGTQMFLKAGDVHTLAQIMNGIAVASANDAAMAVAENLWGSKEACLERMNARAAELGMINTVYYGVHGLPPDRGGQFDQTTARDVAVLARECVQSPYIMHWTGQKEVALRAGEAARANTNKLLWRMDDCDGLKTGFIRAAKFCIAATAERGGLRLISVVLGHPDKYGRFNLAGQLLEEGFEQICKVKAASQGETVTARTTVRDAATSLDAISVMISSDLYVIVNKAEVDQLELVHEVPAELVAPIQRGDELGALVVQLSGVPLGQIPLLALTDIEAAVRVQHEAAVGEETLPAAAAIVSPSWSRRAWRSFRSRFYDEP